jgi:hypothetical protein
MNGPISTKQPNRKIDRKPIDQLTENGTQMNKINALLIHATMSRARMLRPQEQFSEASRSARQIAMRSREENRRMLGNW